MSERNPNAPSVASVARNINLDADKEFDDAMAFTMAVQMNSQKSSMVTNSDVPDDNYEQNQKNINYTVGNVYENTVTKPFPKKNQFFRNVSGMKFDGNDSKIVQSAVKGIHAIAGAFNESIVSDAIGMCKNPNDESNSSTAIIAYDFDEMFTNVKNTCFRNAGVNAIKHVGTIGAGFFGGGNKPNIVETISAVGLRTARVGAHFGKDYLLGKYLMNSTAYVDRTRMYDEIVEKGKAGEDSTKFVNVLKKVSALEVAGTLCVDLAFNACETALEFNDKTKNVGELLGKTRGVIGGDVLVGKLLQTAKSETASYYGTWINTNEGIDKVRKFFGKVKEAEKQKVSPSEGKNNTVKKSE